MISMCEAVEDQFLWHWQFFNFRFCNFDDQEGKARAHLWETITVTPFWVFSVTMFSLKSTRAANFPPVTWQVCHARLDFPSKGKVTCDIISTPGNVESPNSILWRGMKSEAVFLDWAFCSQVGFPIFLLVAEQVDKVTLISNATESI